MKKIHADIRIHGIVQGVGFRPFVHKIARGLSLSGTVCNTSFGAEVICEGSECDIDSFCSEIKHNAPPLALIENVDIKKSDTLCGFSGFCIMESEQGKVRRTLISPDIAVCDDCLRELYDKSDRRYRYPFISCTACGPRFSIQKAVPYDRETITMDDFPMCEACENEYTEKGNIRRHAQTIACKNC